jgi:hypothetical protein
MVHMPIRTGGQAPYAPPQTVLALIRSYRNRGLQTPFSSDVLQRAGVPESLVARTLQSLRLLDLVDEHGDPAPEFEGLRRAGQAEYPERLAAIIRAVYAEVFQYVDPAEDDEGKVRDAFRAYEPLGQLTRIVRLFYALCEEAKIIPEGKRKAAPVAGARPSRPQRSTAAERGRQRTGGRHQDDAPTPPPPDVAIPPAIAGLLAALPKNGTGWTRATRDRFLATFTAVLDFSISIREPREQADDDDPPTDE